jgi:hypothetical protein
MRARNLLLALCAMAAAPAFAQVLGTVVNVNGVATVTTGTSGLAITAGAPIVNGARVITTSSGSVTFRLNNGCTVTVPPGHAVTVLSALSCQQLQAAVQPVITTTSTTAVTTGAMVPVGPAFQAPPGIVAGWAALLGLAVLAHELDDDDEGLSAQ